MTRLSYFLFLPLLLLVSCEKGSVESEVMTLENDFIEAEMNGRYVRFDGFRFGQDKSYYRAADPGNNVSAELRITRTTADGLDDITLLITDFDLDKVSESKNFFVGRAGDQMQEAEPGVVVHLLSRESSDSGHCPYLDHHSYQLEGMFYIDAWSPETGILEGRFEAEKVFARIEGEPGQGINLVENLVFGHQVLRQGSFRVWVQQL